MEIRCLSCICAMCKIENICKEKPCNDSTDPYECTMEKWSCDKYNELEDEKNEKV